jgi:hypothetical protein
MSLYAVTACWVLTTLMKWNVIRPAFTFLVHSSAGRIVSISFLCVSGVWRRGSRFAALKPRLVRSYIQKIKNKEIKDQRPGNALFLLFLLSGLTLLPPHLLSVDQERWKREKRRDSYIKGKEQGFHLHPSIQIITKNK